MSQFNSARRRGNYAVAGRAAADDALRLFLTARESSPDYGRLAREAAIIRSAEKKAAIKASADLATTAVDIKSDLKAEQIKVDADTYVKKMTRKAGAISAAGDYALYGAMKRSEKSGERRDGSEYKDYFDKEITELETKLGENTNGIPSISTDTDGNNTGDQQGIDSAGKVSTVPTTVTKPPIIATGVKGGTAMRLMTDLTNDGYTPVQAAAIVGNAKYESADFTAHEEFEPNSYGTKGAGYLQWTNAGGANRRDSFENFASLKRLDPRSYEANTGYMMHELKGGAGNHWTGGMSDTNFRKINDLGTAVTTFQNTYLRPNPSVANTQQRMKYAEDILNQWNSLGS
jgi:hypothetical protein